MGALGFAAGSAWAIEARADDSNTAESAGAAPTNVSDPEAGSVFELAGFGMVGSVGLGWPDGDDAGPARSVYGPKFALDLHLELSYAFVYAGFGFTHLEFDDRDPRREQLVNVETGDEIDLESKATAGMLSGEIGIAHGFRLGKWFAIRPGIGIGVSGAGEVNRDVANCADCSQEVVLDKYLGGKFVRAQFGGYLRIPGMALAFGPLASYQQYLGEVDDPALNRTILLGFAFAGGGGL